MYESEFAEYFQYVASLESAETILRKIYMRPTFGRNCSTVCRLVFANSLKQFTLSLNTVS